ncbi:PepSY-associated TM helix domain-containing protein [Terrilactibacillus sp. S3-3]|nr:PepSY-associated TM helix domain-containing protein [Terrilactibacillus sp. S3-3]
MRKVKRIHFFWIGVITSIFLLIESITGIYMYFQETGEKHTVAKSSFSQSGNQSASGGSSAQSSSQPPAFNQSGSGSPPSGGNFQGGGDRGGSSFGGTMRSLHSGIIGLIAGFGMLILTVTGLAMSAIIWKANRKKKNC